MDSIIVDRIYQTFRNEILRENDAEKLIAKTEDFGLFSWSHYPGIYTDKLIEDKLAAAMLPSQNTTYTPQQNHYVYIATRLFEVGGHSRCILHFIDNFKNAKHTVILLNQKKTLPVNLNVFFKSSGTEVIHVKSKSFLEKATLLRQEINEIQPSRIFLFTHPNDLVPMMSFGNFHPCEINLFNHADHTFWIGGKWIDSIIDFRSTGLAVTRQSRNYNRSELLLLPVNFSYEQISKSAAKQKLGFSPDQRIAGTLTNISKVQNEKGNISFADFLFERALENADLKFIVIGLSENEFCCLLTFNKKIPSNISCLGIVPDPDEYFQAFDFFIEPFPIASPLGMLEACKYGAVPVFAPHECELSASFEAFHHSIQSLYKRSATIDDLRINFNETIKASNAQLEKRSQNIIELIGKYHRGKHWADCLEDQSLLQKDISLAPVVDPLKEMQFFRNYVKKTPDELFEYLFQLKALVSKKVLFSFFAGRNKIFSLFQLSFKSYKLLFWKLIRG